MAAVKCCILILAILSLSCTSAFSHNTNHIYRRMQHKRVQHCGPKLSIETPKCTVLQKRDGYELRRYPDGQMWIETLVTNNSYREAMETGFYRCYDFISGKNAKHETIEMTAPVLVEPASDEMGYKVAFFVPSRFKSVADVPTPSDPSVKIIVARAKVVAVVGPFGGFPDEVEYEKKWKELKKTLGKDSMQFDEESVAYAGYSSPSLHSNRKQEVHVGVFPQLSP